MTIPVPSNLTPFVSLSRLITLPWQLFIQALVAKPAASSAVIPNGSPFSYQATGTGVMIVTGGTVSNISILRGITLTDTGLTVGPFTLGEDDTLIVTYTVLPTMTFLPA
jgi:hypothetical protein